ncbi:hypothetical protein X801_05845, partial [Opisthorchis viverrini]
MHYGGKLDIRITVLWFLGDEAEEGEVYDGSDQEEADSDTGTRVYEAPENNSYDGRSQLITYFIRLLFTPPISRQTKMTVLIRLNQMSHMHQMYQKACEFYERAAAKVVSAGLNLPLAVPPKPPPVSLLLPQPGPPQPAPPVRRPGDSNATHYPIVPSGDPNASSKSSEAHVPPHTPRSENIPPPAPALSADRSNYSLAYAAAYKQTVGTIPPPENGGPAPNTPEYSALWQRYMDYYLRYYMQAYASMVPNGPSKPGAAINPPETATISPTKTSVSGEEEKPVPPKASQTKEDENSSASKRPKLSEKVNSEASVKTDNEKQDTASDVKVYAQTTQPAEQPTTEAPKATAPPSSDD